MPVPKGSRFRFKSVSKNRRQRLAFKNSKVVEVVGYRKKKGRWVEEYTRSFPKK